MLVESGFPCFYRDNNGMVINDGWPGNPGTNRGYIAGKKKHLHGGSSIALFDYKIVNLGHFYIYRIHQIWYIYIYTYIRAIYWDLRWSFCNISVTCSWFMNLDYLADSDWSLYCFYHCFHFFQKSDRTISSQDRILWCFPLGTRFTIDYRLLCSHVFLISGFPKIGLPLNHPF